jgi:putative hydrolase of the HAD superfamily
VTLRAALFDAAGTLLETARPVGEVYAELARAHGVALPAARLDDAFRRILAQAPPMVFPDAPAADIPALERGWWRAVVRSTFLAADATARFADFESFFGELWSCYAAPSAWRARPGAHAALRALRQRGLATGVVSNFDGRLPGILAGLGLAVWLDVVMLPGDARAAKPDPRIFALALARLGVAASQAVYLGDDPVRDLAAARAAGLVAIGIGGLATLADLPARLLERAEADGSTSQRP